VEEDQLKLALEYSKMLGERWSNIAERLLLFTDIMREEERRRLAKYHKARVIAEQRGEKAFRRLTKAIEPLRGLEIHKGVEVLVVSGSRSQEYILALVDHGKTKQTRRNSPAVHVAVSSNVSPAGEIALNFMASTQQRSIHRALQTIQDVSLDVVVNRALWWLAGLAKDRILKVEASQNKLEGRKQQIAEQVAEMAKAMNVAAEVFAPIPGSGPGPVPDEPHSSWLAHGVYKKGDD
jgi:hypothetical protein